MDFYVNSGGYEMKKEKLIKVPDWKKWLIELFGSLIIWAIFSVILIPVANQTIIIFVIISIAMVAYWIYSYIKAKKYVTIKEFREKNKKGISGYTEYDLKKQKYSDEEIKKILGNNYKVIESREEKPLSNANKSMCVGFIITLIISVWIGI